MVAFLFKFIYYQKIQRRLHTVRHLKYDSIQFSTPKKNIPDAGSNVKGLLCADSHSCGLCLSLWLAIFLSGYYVPYLRYIN